MTPNNGYSDPAAHYLRSIAEHTAAGRPHLADTARSLYGHARAIPAATRAEFTPLAMVRE